MAQFSQLITYARTFVYFTCISMFSLVFFVIFLMLFAAFCSSDKDDDDDDDDARFSYSSLNFQRWPIHQ